MTAIRIAVSQVPGWAGSIVIGGASRVSPSGERAAETSTGESAGVRPTTSFDSYWPSWFRSAKK